MKNFKPMTHAPKGALCACGDKLGPHYLSLAEGGSVPELSDDEYLARLEMLRRQRGGGRRPERLNASRDVNVPARLLRGWVAGTAGLPGDIEGIGRLAVNKLPPQMLPGPLGASLWASKQLGLDDEPALPTSEFYEEWLPGHDASPAGRAVTKLGSFAGGAGATKVARGVQKGSGVVARGALDSVRRAMEGQGPLAGALAPVAPAYAVKPRGGNVNDTAVDRLLDALGQRKSEPTQAWLKKNMRNYLKRDFGAPTDPLLALEKELPNLHINEDAWPVTRHEVDRLYDLRQEGREMPSLLMEQRAGPHANMVKIATPYLDKHDALAGGDPLTRWGRAADSNIMSGKAGEELAYELGEKWPISAMYPGTTGGIDELLRHTDEMIGRFGANPDSLGSKSNNTRLEKLKKYRETIAEKMATDWRAKTPDADVFQPQQAAAGDLGFDHMTDYIEAATEPYRLVSEYGEDGAAILDKLRKEGVDAAMAVNMTPVTRGHLERYKALMDAGLDVDPASLPRMGVADVSRKTAAWNEFLANQGPSNEALQKGWKVHKEYGPEQGGMKWVEFGGPDSAVLEGMRAKLPEGAVVQKNPTSGQWAVYGPEYAPGQRSALYNPANTEEDALREFWKTTESGALRAGLSAEGDAMGHCVGGYCDDVIRNGTRIYSLRDAKGAPHVTVEVRGGQPATQPEFDELDDIIGLNSPYEAEARDRLAAVYDGDDTAVKPLDWLRDAAKNHPNAATRNLATRRLAEYEERPPEIVQIKGKGNAAPVEKYLPMVQDFVRSGKWGRVGDLGNTGLRQARDVFGNVIPEGMAPEQYITLDEALKLSDPRDHEIYRSAWEARRRGYAHGGRVEADDTPKGFLPRTFEEWVEYAERLLGPAAHNN